MKLTAEEYRKKYIKEAGKKVFPPPATKKQPIPAERETEVEELDGSGYVEPLIRRVFSSIVIGRKILPEEIADIQYHPELIEVRIENRTFQIKITEK